MKSSWLDSVMVETHFESTQSPVREVGVTLSAQEISPSARGHAREGGWLAVAQQVATSWRP